MGQPELRARGDDRRCQRAATQGSRAHRARRSARRWAHRDGRRYALPRPGPLDPCGSQPALLRDRPRRDVAELHERPVRRPARDRCPRHPARLANRARRPARAPAARRRRPDDDHHRPGRLLRPGLRPVLAARLPIQPAPRGAARPALLVFRPRQRLRRAARPRTQPHQHPADPRALGRHPARPRIALDRHGPRERAAARPARRRTPHAAGPRDRRDRARSQDAAPAALR